MSTSLVMAGIYMEFFRNIKKTPRKEQKMVKKLIAVIIGLAVAMLLVSVIQKWGHSLYPLPTDMDLADQEFMSDYVANLPWGPLVFVLGSYFAGTLVGGWVAAFIARESPLVIAGFIGLAVLAGAIANMVIIPHPTWFATAAVIGIIVAVMIAAKLASGRSVHRKVY